MMTNVPEILTFNFDQWKEWENTGDKGIYKTYSIGVECRGVDGYLSVYEREYNEVFKPLGALKGRVLEILKYEDGKYKAWKIMENGVDITPGRSDSSFKSSTSPVPVEYSTSVPKEDFEALQDRVERMAQWAAGMEKKVDGLRTLLVDLRGEPAVDLHESLGKSETFGTTPVSFEEAKNILQ